MESTMGINFYGLTGLETGLGEAARNNIEALRRSGLLVNEIDISASAYNEVQTPEDTINIIQINPDNLDSFYERYAHNVSQGSYNIAFWAWETEEFPEEDLKYFTYFDEIWTPSGYCQNVISKKSPVPVLNMPHAIPVEERSDGSEYLRRKVLGTRENTFIFSFFFDYKSQIIRKNVLGVIESFRKAFGSNAANVSLLLKTYPSEHHLHEKAIIEEKIGNDPSIVLFEESLERSELQDLLGITDCYVSLHRSEGFGLTMAEAMAVGKPVIATAYSGNMEYMNVNNALLVKYKMTTLTKAVGPFPIGSVWADPDLDHAAVLMRRVYAREFSEQEITTAAKAQIQGSHNLSRVGQLMSNRITLITRMLQTRTRSNFEQETLLLRIENDLLNTKLNKIRNISFVKLKLKFKNLKNRLTGKNRKYMWE
ncbi:glycosyltransferase [Sphingobacterium olei]|uniref:Glycosyltransferase n=1 Tax=Sphingobacterium olei TaxID=2571155 RepID=A0A4V5MMF3_9SPHI|nr:glycosyltransferase [Sphingobacterium olei]TJZ60748.1 glycosyltransferase [Sphingobacterium olei]